MELRHLKYFVAVAEELNFRSAADRLHVSRPALSKQIKDLECEIGVRLLERNTVCVWLTNAGRRFLDDARAILSRVEQAVAAAKSEAQDENSLVIASAGPFWDAALNDLLKRFRKRFPHIDIRMVDVEPWNQIAGLQRGQFQLGFVGEREIISSPTFGSAFMLRSSFGVIVGAEHRLAALQTVRWEDIKNEKIYCLGLGRSSPHLTDIRDILPQGMISRQQIKKVESIQSLITMLTTCQGISLLPQAFVTSRASTLHFLPLEDARMDLQFDLRAVWRTDDLSKVLQSFVELIKAHSGQTPE
jgi:LysR family transcriptional regulator, benzoate and cis,cis-muconate-responsive activator of ben and cat genes